MGRDETGEEEEGEGGHSTLVLGGGGVMGSNGGQSVGIWSGHTNWLHIITNKIPGHNSPILMSDWKLMSDCSFGVEGGGYNIILLLNLSVFY